MIPNVESLQRAKELEAKTKEYRSFKRDILKTEDQRYQNYLNKKQHILSYYGATEKDWENWHWQVRNRIHDVDTLLKFISVSKETEKEIREAAKHNRFGISPYYLANISDEPNDPFFKLSVPSIAEILDTTGETDPMNEKFTNPAGSITRRYPDRVIINVTNICAMYCRHCQRRRLIGETDRHTDQKLIFESIEYIRNHEEIRDVLLTGGDALLLSDSTLESILKELRSIKHVEIIRIGSRTPVTMPMRITKGLLDTLKKYHPIYLNTHFNHPFEINKRAQIATTMLSDAGITVGNQAVLLKGINDDPFIMTYMNQKLLMSRVRPYYIFHAKSVRGTSHFIPSLKTGLSIMEFMRGFTSGLAIPTYIMNAPGGLGKVPLLPTYIMDEKDGVFTIRTWENKLFKYDDNH
jgi:lysine 2,3-aminomutase